MATSDHHLTTAGQGSATTESGWQPPSHEKPFNGAHWGILARWFTAAENVRSLLPGPLEPGDPERPVAMFINETTALNAPLGDLATIEPSHVRFREALIFLPCSYRGEEFRFNYVMFTDSEWNVHIGNLVGLAPRFARIDLLLPCPPNPFYSVVEPSSPLKATVSNSTERLATVTFAPQEHIPGTGVTDFDRELLGRRHVPDILAPSGRPALHDLVFNDIANRSIESAWRGTCTIELGGSGVDGLRILEPTEPCESYYIEGFTYEHRGPRLFYDYLEANDG